MTRSLGDDNDDARTLVELLLSRTASSTRVGSIGEEQCE